MLSSGQEVRGSIARDPRAEADARRQATSQRGTDATSTRGSFALVELPHRTITADPIPRSSGDAERVGQDDGSTRAGLTPPTCLTGPGDRDAARKGSDQDGSTRGCSWRRSGWARESNRGPHGPERSGRLADRQATGQRPDADAGAPITRAPGWDGRGLPREGAEVPGHDVGHGDLGQAPGGPDLTDTAAASTGRPVGLGSGEEHEGLTPDRPNGQCGPHRSDHSGRAGPPRRPGEPGDPGRRSSRV